jgi:hypothetical protein
MTTAALITLAQIDRQTRGMEILEKHSKQSLDFYQKALEVTNAISDPLNNLPPEQKVCMSALLCYAIACRTFVDLTIQNNILYNMYSL